ncbi:MAG: aminotransferase class I/II-fold pyridoxal phosphate-dependent enzyme [Bacteroidota bacterium]
MIQEEIRSDFQLTEEEIRHLGSRVLDFLTDHWTSLRDKKITNTLPFEEMSKLIPDALPWEGRSADEVLDHVVHHVFKHILHTDHPRFFSFVPAPMNVIGAMADFLVAGFNPFAGHWLAGSGPTKVELVTIDWLRQLCGFPEAAGGLFVSGGSMANLTALATARHVKMGEEFAAGTIYYSQQTHSSLAKGLRILGISKKRLRPIPVNESYQIDLEALENVIQEDMENGLRPFCVVGNAGTTNTGAIDDLKGLARIADVHDLWFHVDGAYGAAAILTDRGKELLTGMELADSLTIDPHKWWFQPFEIGGLLVRNKRYLKSLFYVTAEYLEATEREEPKEISFFKHGIQLTRSFRALKLYMSLKIFGLASFSQAIQKGLDWAEYVQQLLEADPVWRVVSPATLGIICFQYTAPDLSPSDINALNQTISNKMTEEGFALVLPTHLRGQTVLRICPIHPALTKHDLDQTISKLKTYGDEILMNRAFRS